MVGGSLSGNLPRRWGYRSLKVLRCARWMLGLSLWNWSEIYILDCLSFELWVVSVLCFYVLIDHLWRARLASKRYTTHFLNFCHINKCSYKVKLRTCFTFAFALALRVCVHHQWWPWDSAKERPAVIFNRPVIEIGMSIPHLICAAAYSGRTYFCLIVEVLHRGNFILDWRDCRSELQKNYIRQITSGSSSSRVSEPDWKKLQDLLFIIPMAIQRHRIYLKNAYCNVSSEKDLLHPVSLANYKKRIKSSIW